MKTLFLSTLALLLSIPTFADTWDCMTKDEALSIKSYIESESPYILDYCDCCESSGSLVFVREVEIIQCEYDSEMYSVQVRGNTLAEFDYAPNGVFDDNIYEPMDDQSSFEGLVSLNYTLGLGKSGFAENFSSLIQAETWNGDPCTDEVFFPSPEAVVYEPFAATYKKWFRKRGAK